MHKEILELWKMYKFSFFFSFLLEENKYMNIVSVKCTVYLSFFLNIPSRLYLIFVREVAW